MLITGSVTGQHKDGACLDREAVNLHPRVPQRMTARLSVQPPCQSDTAAGSAWAVSVVSPSKLLEAKDVVMVPSQAKCCSRSNGFKPEL